jgi:DNA-binding transcriptional ArsR family regulator
MTVLFRREVPLRTLLAITGDQARAISQPVRLAMLELLAKQPMSIDELARELPKHGFRQAPNTLRHHLELLRNAGLVEQAVLEQNRGAVLQYYSATGRPMHNRLPEESEVDMEALAAALRTPVRQALNDLRAEQGTRLRRVVGQVERCPRCQTDHARDLILLTAVHRATMDYLKDEEAAPASDPMPARSSRQRRA